MPHHRFYTFAAKKKVLNKLSIAVVGTRKMSNYGKQAAEELVSGLGAVISKEAKVRRDLKDIVVYEVGRLNVWAVAVAHWAYGWAVEQEIGTPFSLSGE